MNFYLAVDAGGTKTDYLVADDTQVLARVQTGTIKRMRIDNDTAAANLDMALAQIASLTGISMSQVTRSCIGTAGESVPLVADWLRESFSHRVGGELVLLGDVEIALDAAFQGGPGVVVIAGTGSNVAGRTASGQLTTAGGWGPALADQGSGYKIGVEALRALFLARDEGHATLLLPAVLSFWELTSWDQIVEYANRLPAPDFSRLTALVLDCANQGDTVAKAVLQREGDDLGYLVRLVLRRLALEANDAWVPSLAFAGSIMEKVPPVRDALIAAVQREFPSAVALDGVVDPILGALWRARTGS